MMLSSPEIRPPGLSSRPARGLSDSDHLANPAWEHPYLALRKGEGHDDEDGTPVFAMDENHSLARGSRLDRKSLSCMSTLFELTNPTPRAHAREQRIVRSLVVVPEIGRHRPARQAAVGCQGAGVELRQDADALVEVYLSRSRRSCIPFRRKT